MTLNDERFYAKAVRLAAVWWRWMVEWVKSYKQGVNEIIYNCDKCGKHTHTHTTEQFIYSHTWQHVAKFIPDVQTHYLCMKMARYWHISPHFNFKVNNANVPLTRKPSDIYIYLCLNE